MILETNGMLIHRGGRIELLDQPDDTLTVQVTNQHGSYATVTLSLAEAGHLSNELRLALKRIEEQEK